MKLIDISKYQRGINWKKVKDAGIKGVIIRAGFGSSVDPMFKEHITNAIKHGFHIGIYWFSYACSVTAGANEARRCLEVIDPYKKHIDLGVWHDWEYDSIRYARKHGVKPTKSLVTNITKAFLKLIHKAGYIAGFYFNLDFKNNFYDLNELKAYKKWYARYISKTPTGVDVWQYSSKGKVDGISGNVDMDILLNESLIEKTSDVVKPVSSPAPVSIVNQKVSETKMPTIKRGSKGKAVKIWQIICGADSDGSFGQDTEKKTKEFQKAHELKEDGIVGPKTWRAGLESV